MNELVEIVNNRVVVSSRQVAEHFGKEHKDVLRSIEQLLRSAQNCANLFMETTLPDSYGRQQKAHLMNRDGFTLLAMGFTGAKALEWKLKYIAAFNEMEKRLSIPTMTITEIVAHNAMQLLKQEQAIKETRQEVAAIREVVVVRPDQKRQWINSTINKIVSAMGGDKDLYGKIKTETYLLLNSRLGANVYTRRNNRNVKGSKVSVLDVILEDKKLTEGYIAILKEYAIKYGVAA